MSAILTVEALHIAYGAHQVLKDLSLSLYEGEIVTVLGANGAGKSTLLRAIAGLVPIGSGSVILGGRILNEIPAHEIVLNGIALVPEGRNVFSLLTVEENLNLGAFTKRKQKEVVAAGKEQVFSLFPVLKQRRRQLAGTLSGGEQQMLAIGRALMITPRVLLLDEPSLGLAPKLVNQIFDIVVKINCQGTSILLVEQNVHQSLAIAGRGYVLESGRIALSGPAEELKRDWKIREAYLGGAALSGRRDGNPAASPPETPGD